MWKSGANQTAVCLLYPVPGVLWEHQTTGPLMWSRGDLLKHLLSLNGIRVDTFLSSLLPGSHHSAGGFTCSFNRCSHRQRCGHASNGYETKMTEFTFFIATIGHHYLPWHILNFFFFSHTVCDLRLSGHTTLLFAQKSVPLLLRSVKILLLGEI